MPENFKYDVFLSHSSKDKAVVRPVAERLRKDGLKVWLDDWEIHPGDSIPAKIEEGLEHSRVLVLCMSANAFGSDWAQLEAGTFRFRDPLNKQRRFIPLRLDEAPIKGSLAQFLYINWLPANREQEYTKLVGLCRPPAKPPTAPESASAGVTGSAQIEQGAETDDDKERAAERRWQYIQTHAIRGVKILFILKGPVGFDWFRDLLDDTRLTFSRDEPSFKLGRLLALSSAPNTKEPSRDTERPICSFWEVYEPEVGYWFKKITPAARSLSTVAGFDAVAPWPVLGVKRVEKLRDLALLTEIGVAIPARAYQVGVEEFEIGIVGDTFAFSVKLSENGLDALQELARVQHTSLRGDNLMPLGTHFSGVQLLEMFLQQFLPRPKDEGSKSRGGIAGMTGPKGKAISFYPCMPNAFSKTCESDEYAFTIKVPPQIDSAAHIKTLVEKVGSNPTDTESYVKLAALYSYEGRLKEVIQCLETAIKQAPPSADVHLMMGEALTKMGRFDEALTHFQEAADLAPDKAAAQSDIGVCLHELGTDDAALAHFEAAVRMEPSKAVYQSNLAMALAKLKRYSEAIAFCQRASDLAPDDAQNEMYLGMLLEIEGRTAEATPHLERAAQLAPDSAEANERFGQQLANTNEHEKAVARLQRALDIEESARRFELLAVSLGELDRWAEAEAALRRAVKLDPNNSDLLAYLGAAVANVGRFSEAAELCGQVVRVNPSNVTAQQCLAQLRELEGQTSFMVDSESKERTLVGEVISTVALAGQISREFNVSDHGIDMEIEFKDDAGEATGRKLYLQLKSGDSYLRERKGDGAEIFTIKDERYVRYWMAQKFPVLLVIRNSEGEVRWMRIDDYLTRESGDGKKPVKHIEFEGERFDVMSVRRWRDKALGRSLP